ncbi:uncharacterized protein LOC142886082 isoform X1 [Nelusetta ayraudi]|uniref:uncharacterized protein LOC142886082 isoform X1 n=1 Tax=Nelusetta ayraudi TaxID=303726 RepID=UPI003F71AD3B
MAGAPPPSPSQQNGTIRPSPGPSSGAGLGGSPTRTRTRTRTSTSPLRSLRTLGGLLGPGAGSDRSSTRPRGRSVGSALGPSSRTSGRQCCSSQQEEPEALLDLILECQGQRLEDQRASLSLLPDPEPDWFCGSCSPDQAGLPTLDFYCRLIQYQSHRMDDQRCSLPDLDRVLATGAEGQEDFLSLVERVQSRRMDEQRASLQSHPAGSAHLHHPPCHQ